MTSNIFENNDILYIILLYIESISQLNFLSCNKYLRKYFYDKHNFLINLNLNNSNNYCTDPNFLIEFNKLILNPNKYFSLNLKDNFSLFFKFNQKLNNKKLISLIIDSEYRITDSNINNLINIEILDFNKSKLNIKDINKLINLKELYLT